MDSGERERLHRGEGALIAPSADTPAATIVETSPSAAFGGVRNPVPPPPEIGLRAATSWLRRR